MYAMRTSYPGPFRECEHAVLWFFFESCRKWSVDKTKPEKINNVQWQTFTALADFLSVSSEPCSFFIKSYDPSENHRNSCHVFWLKCWGALGHVRLQKWSQRCGRLVDRLYAVQNLLCYCVMHGTDKISLVNYSKCLHIIDFATIWILPSI